MFGKKSKMEEKDTLKVNFKIPQIDASSEGIRKGKLGFKSSLIGSPMFGSQVKDELIFPDLTSTVDIKKNYDNFRKTDEKLISEKELIEKYGTKYFEFDMISNKTRKEVYGVDVPHKKANVQPEKADLKKKKEFSFVQDKNSFIQDNNQNKEKEIIDKKESVNFNISFDDEDNDNSFEINSFEYEKMEKPNSKIPSFLFDEYTNTDIKPDLIKPEVIKSSDDGQTYFDFNEVETIKKEIIKKETTIKTEAIKENKKIEKPNQKKVEYVLPSPKIFSYTLKTQKEYPEWLEEKKDIINQTLQDFDISGEVVNYTMGPTLTRYEVLLSSGVNVRKIVNLYDTFQMNLGVKTLRIQAPIPGKKTIGLEVPNDTSETVFFGDIINNEFYNNDSPLLIALGKDIDEKAIYAEVDKMPHGLIGGSTGSGKSVCINTILVSLLLKNKPDDLRLILIDPKKVELIAYNELPHLVTPVIDDPQMASEALKWAVDEMERRYADFSANRVRNIKDYNKKVQTESTLEKMPYIVIVIDELADLMMVCSSDVEDAIRRLTQKSRAAGIHLLVATQRPTVDVVKGTIKANIPARIAFKVFSGTDSITILDETGADQLLGRGDMLIKQSDIPHRLQGAYISDQEIDAVTDFIRGQSIPNYIFTHDDLKKKIDNSNVTGGSSSSNESPETIYQIAKYCIEENTCSINSIQQQFNFGFNRAQRMVQILEEMGIVSAKRGTKGREILIDLYELDERFDKDN